jgi:hypothetical protein
VPVVVIDRFWPIFAGQGALIALVRSDANNWASRMQMAGQLECKRVVKWNAILHPERIAALWP